MQNVIAAGLAASVGREHDFNMKITNHNINVYNTSKLFHTHLLVR